MASSKTVISTMTDDRK